MNNQTRRKSVRERLSKYTTKYRVADWVEIHVGKRTPSDPIETGRCGKRPSDIAACQFARHLEIYNNVEYSERDGKCRQMASFGSDGDGLPWQHLLTLKKKVQHF